LISGGAWEGPLSLRKSMTFGLSFGLTLINVTLIASFVHLKDRSRTLLLGIFAAGMRARDPGTALPSTWPPTSCTTFRPEISKQGERRQRRQADVVFGEPCAFDRWPDVPIHVIAGCDDRFFPLDFQRRIARERLHLAVDALGGGHLIALSNPHGLVRQLLSYL
jgi:hypothetical protein